MKPYHKTFTQESNTRKCSCLLCCFFHLLVILPCSCSHELSLNICPSDKDSSSYIPLYNQLIYMTEGGHNRIGLSQCNWLSKSMVENQNIEFSVFDFILGHIGIVFFLIFKLLLKIAVPLKETGQTVVFIGNVYKQKE